MSWDDLQTPDNVEALPITVQEARAIAYTRESCDRLLALFGQDEQIRQWAEREGYTIVGCARDNDVPGKTPVDDRKGLTIALQRLAEPEINAIIVSHLDRISRSVPVMLDAVDRIWALDCDIICCEHGMIPRGPVGRRFCEFVAREAEIETEQITRRLQNARRAKAARQGYIGGTRIHGRPYGRRRQGREYVPVPEEQAVIQRMRDMYVPWEFGWSRIANQLNAEGVPTVTGAPWTGRTVGRLIGRKPLTLALVQNPVDKARSVTGDSNLREAAS